MKLDLTEIAARTYQCHFEIFRIAYDLRTIIGTPEAVKLADDAIDVSTRLKFLFHEVMREARHETKQRSISGQACNDAQERVEGKHSIQKQVDHDKI